MNHLLEINRQQVVDNINVCSGSKQVCLMVKANTYGLGNEAVAMLIDLGYRFFGVSTLEEALNVRSLCADAKILLVSYLSVADINTCITHNITFTVYDFELLSALTPEANFHLKIDTNMGRLGFKLEELDEVHSYLVANKLQPEGIFSHLACASNQIKTKKAIDNFELALKKFNDFNFQYIHLLNTYGSLNYETKFDNLVRIGIGIWGYLANVKEAKNTKRKVKPALALRLTISHVKNYDGPISYDHLDHVKGWVLTIPLGYHDGFARCFRGYKIPNVGTVVGNVNMCQHMILVDDNNQYKREEMITLFDGTSLYELCEYAQMTTYEFLVSLSDRLKRAIL